LTDETLSIVLGGDTVIRLTRREVRSLVEACCDALQEVPEPVQHVAWFTGRLRGTVEIDKGFIRARIAGQRDSVPVPLPLVGSTGWLRPDQPCRLLLRMRVEALEPLDPSATRCAV
jgi:hypothetical protein